MLTRIFKYPLEATDMQTLVLHGQPISCIEQDGRIVLYATHNGDIPQKRYKIRIAGTGHVIEDIESYVFLGTVKLMHGRFVFHVFYREEE